MNFFKVNIKNVEIRKFKPNIYTNLVALLLLCPFFVQGDIVGWLAMIIASFAIIGNDSPQLIGTYLATRQDEKWYKTFIWVATIFVIMLTLCWCFSDFEIHFAILDNVVPRKINVYYLIAPLILLFLTHNGIPTSSTFLVLSLFLNKGNILNMLTKTAASYFISFAVSAYIFFAILKKYKKYILDTSDGDKYADMWVLLQIVSTIVLVINWLCFSISNITVFLPRKLNLHDFLLFIFILLYTLASVLSNKNNKMQNILSSKKNSNNLKINVLINILFSATLFVFKVINNVSIATTFVFLGILAGKDIAIMFSERDIFGKAYKKTVLGILKDINKCILGVGVSLAFVILINFLNVL
jgi:hypothetical protein